MNFVMLKIDSIPLPGNPKFSFVSNRLADLILRKSLRGEWNRTYFQIAKNTVCFDERFPGELISSNGTILFTKDI